jgi:hypothetical protein
MAGNCHFIGGLLAALYLTAIQAGYANELVRFTSRPMQSGERVTQEVVLAMSLAIHVRSNTAARAGRRDLERRQRRHLELLPRENHDEPRARIDFERSERRQRYDAQVETNLRDPVAGKSYLATRRGQNLVITDLDGRAVPEDERAIVASSLESFGRANPLATFMNGRQIAVGQTIQVPGTVAQTIFSAWRDMVEIDNFELTLTGLDTVDGHRCGVFAATVRGSAPGQPAQPTLLRGKILMELNSCRLPSLEFSGPIHLSQTQASAEGPMTMDCRGTLTVAMRNRPSAAR